MWVARVEFFALQIYMLPMLLLVVFFLLLLTRIPLGILINCAVWLHLSSARGEILIALRKRKD